MAGAPAPGAVNLADMVRVYGYINEVVTDVAVKTLEDRFVDNMRLKNLTSSKGI